MPLFDTSWDLSYADARTLQTELAGQVKFLPFKPKEPFLVAGLDCAFTIKVDICVRSKHTTLGIAKQTAIAGIVVIQVPDFKIVETAHAACEITFPYIPGLLSFREAPACIAAVEKLETKPDLIIIDGQGIAHPRRLGIAAHLGLILDRPTIGCAKSRLIGEHGTLGTKKGASTILTDKDEIIGAVVRTRRDVKPVYVSVGNKCLLENAVELILRCTTKYRLPEPTRLAHQLVTRLKTSL